jgi:hypothetical protein
VSPGAPGWGSCGREGKPKTMKQCRKCKHWKALDEFYRHPNTRDGRGSYCIVCQVNTSIESQAKHPERKAEHNKRYNSRADVLERERDRHRLRRFMKRKELERAAGVFGNESGSRVKY